MCRAHVCLFVESGASFAAPWADETFQAVIMGCGWSSKRHSTPFVDKREQDESTSDSFSGEGAVGRDERGPQSNAHELERSHRQAAKLALGPMWQEDIEEREEDRVREEDKQKNAALRVYSYIHVHQCQRAYSFLQQIAGLQVFQARILASRHAHLSKIPT